MANEIPLLYESSGAFATDTALAQRTASGELKITATKLSFFSVTPPVVWPAHADQAVAVYATQTITNPPTQAEVQNINDGLVTAVRLVNRLRTDLLNLGLIKGSA